MHPTELENLVRIIVEKVLEQLLTANIPLKSLQGTSEKPVSVASSQPSPRKLDANERITDQHLVTEQDVRTWARDGIQKLIIAKTAIITPSAQDYARDHRIRFQRGWQNKVVSIQLPAPSNTIALMAARCHQNLKNAIIDVIEQAGFQTFDIRPDRLSSRDIAVTNVNLAQQIAQKQYTAGIIIDENAFSLAVQANKIENIQAVVGWDIKSVEISQQAVQTNMLYLNNRLLGPGMLRTIIGTWLDSVTKT